MSDATLHADSISTRFLRRHWTLVGLLLLAALVAYLVGNNGFPLVDRDEPRYAQASRQMLQNGDWTTPHLYDDARLKKPVGIYWLQATSMKLLGETAFAARLPSAIATVATIALLSIVLPRIVGHRRAFWSAFVFATAFLTTYLAKVCMTDAVLNLFITAAMLGLFAIWRGRAGWPTLIGFGVAVGLAVMTKGPPVLLYAGMTLVALWAINLTIDEPTFAGAPRTIDVQRAVPAVAVRLAVIVGIVLAICLPWVLRLEAAHPGAIGGMLMKEAVARGGTVQEGHGGPPGYYLLAFWGTFFPWSLFAPAALIHAWRRRRVAWVRFSLAAIVGPWAFLEIYRTKLPHYFLPCFPFLAILTADVLLRSARGAISDLRDRPFIVVATIIGAAFTFASAVVLLGLPWLGGAPIGPSLAAGVLLWLVIALAATVAVQLFREGRTLRAAAALGASSWVILVFLAAVYVPLTPSLTLARRVGESLRDHERERPGPAMMLDFKEPSVAFYEGGTIREQRDGDFLQDAPRELWPRWLVIDEATFEDQPSPIQDRWATVGRFRGLNLAGDGLRPQTVLILENKASPATMPASPPP